MIDSAIDYAWQQIDEPTPTSQDRESFSNAPNRSEISTWEDLDIEAMNQAVDVLIIVLSIEANV
jgi:hypothetical protein